MLNIQAKEGQLYILCEFIFVLTIMIYDFAIVCMRKQIMERIIDVWFIVCLRGFVSRSFTFFHDWLFKKFINICFCNFVIVVCSAIGTITMLTGF